MSRSERLLSRSIAATLAFMFTGSVTASIVHGQSESPLGALDWSLGDFASTFAIAQASLFLTSLCLHKVVSVFSVWFGRTELNGRRRHHNPSKTPMGASQIYRITGVLPHF